jgi:hypothetical protein
MKTFASLGLGILLALSLGCGGDEHEEGHDAPEIQMVAWAHATGCVAGTISDVTITVTAADPNTPLQNLSYSGTVTGCVGEITAAVSTVSCPQAASYLGTVTVSDEEAHNDMLSFTIDVCVDGMAP